MNSMVICLIIFAVMIILFFNRKIPMAFTSMGVIVALYVAGCVDKATVFAGFGNNNVLTMAGMFIVAAGLSRTQMVNNITKLLYRVNNGSFTRVLASYILVIFLLGQFVPSLPAMFAMVYPLVISMCKQLKCSPSKMMYPIAVTVVSTSFVLSPLVLMLHGSLRRMAIWSPMAGPDLLSACGVRLWFFCRPRWLLCC